MEMAALSSGSSFSPPAEPITADVSSKAWIRSRATPRNWAGESRCGLCSVTTRSSSGGCPRISDRPRRQPRAAGHVVAGGIVAQGQGVDPITVLGRPRPESPFDVRAHLGAWPPLAKSDWIGLSSFQSVVSADMFDESLIEEIGRRLAKASPPQSRVVLFGSRARGDERSDSDVDVLVIEPAVGDPIQESVRLRRSLRGLGVPIAVLVVAQEEADRRSAVRGTVFERALREGRVLVDP
jgi:uncharacterized protein